MNANAPPRSKGPLLPPRHPAPGHIPHHGGASAPVRPPERASFGPKAPAIAMAGRPWWTKRDLAQVGRPGSAIAEARDTAKRPLCGRQAARKTRRQGAPLRQNQPKPTAQRRGAPPGGAFPSALRQKIRTSWHVSRILCPWLLAVPRVAVIHLGLPSPAGSSGLPAGSDGPSSIACAGACSLLALLRVGFT